MAKTAGKQQLPAPNLSPGWALFVRAPQRCSGRMDKVFHHVVRASASASIQRDALWTRPNKESRFI